MLLSIIIPTLNEAQRIGRLLDQLKEALPPHSWEVIVVDGGSTDQTRQLVAERGVISLMAPRGRAKQMNAGAKRASGKVLFFLHADCRPPDQLWHFAQQVSRNSPAAGCFRLRFDAPGALFRLLGWATRIDLNCLRFGDQGLLVHRLAFQELRGFDEDRRLLEDNDMVRRLRKAVGFRVFPDTVETSARKYHTNGPIYLQSVYTLLYAMDRLGVGQDKLSQYYDRWIRVLPT